MSRVPPIDALAAADERARERIATDLDTSFLVEAAAGTGKTTALIQRLVAVLASGRTEIDRIAAVTFTRKAAGELKLRLREGLENAREGTGPDDPQRPHVDRALAHLEEASIGTIHSFCAEILHQRPIAAGIDPGFVELDEEQAASIHEQAFRSWIQDSLSRPTRTLERSLARLAHAPGWLSEPPLERLRKAALGLLDWRDFDATWSARPVELTVDIDRLAGRVLEVAAMSEGGGAQDPLFRALAPVRDLADWIVKTESEGERDYATLEARLVAAGREIDNNWKGRGDHYTSQVLRADMLAAKDELQAEIAGFAEQADADLAVALHRELTPLTESYDQLKHRLGAVDFHDLLLMTRDLLAGDTEIRHYFQQRYSHLFVDEFQDTDPIQAEILILLSADDPEVSDWRRVRPLPGKLFLVGDPKQSIYRFRRADVRFYQQVQDQLTAAGVEQLYLARSFRSLPALQELANAAFEPVMQEDRDADQAAYVPLLPVRDASPDQPSIVALPAPRPYGKWSLTKGAVEASLPDATGAFLEWLIKESGWTVEDPQSKEQVPIRSHHVCLLFRRFVGWKSDITNGYVRALEVRGLPHVLVGGRSLHHREEVEVLRTALTAIEWPDDDLAVYATLKGSLFAILDEDLFRYLQAGGRLNPLASRPGDPELAPVVEALDLLADLHRRRNRVRVATTLARLLRETRAHAAFLMRPAGRQVLANIDHLIGLARAWERRDGSSFRGFVDHLVAESESFSTRQPSVLEETEEGVRLMTLHSAKGLEFPVVILADPTTNAVRDPSLTVDPESGLCAQRILGMAPWDLLERQGLERDRDRAEAVRVAYVAATRARDLLVVPVVGELDRGGDFFPATSWIAPLFPTVYPEPERAHLPVVPDHCPAFGSSTVLERAQEHAGRAAASVRPGLHRPRAGGHSVVWWDPAVLDLDVEGNFGVVQKKLLAEPEAGDGGRDAHRDWSERRQRILDRGSQPTRVVHPVSEVDSLPPIAAEDLLTPAVETSRSAGERPQGVRFGTLVHSLLRDAPFDARRTHLQRLADYHRRIHQATDEEARVAVDTAGAALAHPLLRTAAGAERVEREYPFLYRCDDGTILDGVIDLFFIDGDSVTLVDFKTDLTAGTPVPERYRIQMSWYVRVLGHLTERPVRAVLLAV